MVSQFYFILSKTVVHLMHRNVIRFDLEEII